MPRPDSELSRAWHQGYERGSVAASMTNEQRRAFKRWLEDRDADSRALIYRAAQAGATVPRRAVRKSNREV